MIVDESPLPVMRRARRFTRQDQTEGSLSPATDFQKQHEAEDAPPIPVVSPPVLLSRVFPGL